ncbi:type II toxin-antitoxin system HipA family toxin [Cellulomonas bogoriensis]|uniref:Phosphatidylinositol kinase n=1 Tax=Cellulomonas bogoriensis 69B4 = DSM 16987 TaxID=1386082 RepID=A0A0A0BU01_9CELL|nr:type II toxin-antitoxin system HipA family toxin [Cellulomonas bogoriensis]KGM11401.1 phosphatidylinositol kinase [Cellulomonas bogoriensis 69B4 = DSM 16987]
MTSERPTTAFVWIWLPGRTEPVVAGRLDAIGTRHQFTYGRSYLERSDAISLYTPELPLRRGPQQPEQGLDMAGCLADAAPDSWGRRVILARHLGRLDRSSDTTDLPELTYLLESSSDRIGALDFQGSPTDFTPREPSTSSLEEIQEGADSLQAGEALPPALADALFRGTSIGGARPKATFEAGGRAVIAKFSTATDTYPVVKAEAVAMELARRVGITAPRTEVATVAGRDALLIDRFDRQPGGGRRQMVSALTMLKLGEMTARYATYPDLADLIRQHFTEPAATLRELFTRIVFNVAIGNTDDHARNHAAFWDGTHLTLTPAYDLCPQVRNVGETDQAMAIGRGGQKSSRFATCIAAADNYLISEDDARGIVDRIIATVHDEWADAAEAACLTSADRGQLWHRQILNPSTFYE